MELIGKVIIQENIDTIERNKLPKTFVINVPDPLKSYYNRFTTINKPSSVIFVTKKPNSFEKILRVTSVINKKYNTNLDGGKCEVAMGSRKLTGVRVKGINRYTDIQQVQQYFVDEGFEFAKSETFKERDALIRINRFFDIKELKPGIYKSNLEDDTYYLTVPRFMTWEEFRTYTFEIKNNIADSNYDIAKGIFYMDHSITEMLRVVKQKIGLEMLEAIQNKYIEKLQ